MYNNRTSNVHFHFYPQENIRKKAKQRHYIREGFKKLIASPLKSIIVLTLMMIAFIATWKVADIFIPKMTTISLFIPILTYAARVLILTILLLLVAGFLWLLGSPPKSREIDNDVAAAFGITRALFHRRPFLISKKPVKGSSVKEYVFWSRWIDLDQWNKPENKKAILWALNAHSDDNFTHGKQKYTVVIRVGSGSEPQEREIPQDPLFK
jgi:hypothetical protein